MHWSLKVLLGLLFIAAIVFGILGLTGFFVLKNTNNTSLPLYSEAEMGLYNTTVKCRQKYPNNPYAFGNDKRKMSKGCYTCPDGYFIAAEASLDDNDTPTCWKYSGYKPAKSTQNENEGLRCDSYFVPNSTTIDNDSIYPHKGLSPWETIQPTACRVRDTQYVPATYLGKS
jgi:hypothetical protein